MHDWELLASEWFEHVLFGDKQCRTVPMLRLEQDLAEGKQDDATKYVPWHYGFMNQNGRVPAQADYVQYAGGW